MLWAALLARDLGRIVRGGGVVLPVAFFLLVATLLPFAVGPDAALLGRIGGGMLLLAALLAALMPVDRLFAPDVEAGVIDQLVVRGVSEEAIVAARLAAHWLGFGPPLMLAALPASALLRLEGAALWRIELALVLATPGLAALGIITAALTLGLRGAGALAGLILLPLAVPLLIFAAGALDMAGGGAGALKLLGAGALLLVALAPFAGATALRAARD